MSVSKEASLSSQLKEANAEASISSNGPGTESNSIPEGDDLEEFLDNDSVYSDDSSPELDESLLPAALPHPDVDILVDMPEDLEPTHDPETGVEQSLVLDQLDTTQPLTVDLSEVQSEHAGKAEGNAGSEELRATSSEEIYEVKDSVPVGFQGKDDDRNRVTLNLNVDPDGNVSVEMPELIAPTHDPEAGDEKPPTLDRLEAHATIEEQQELSGQVNSFDDNDATGTKQKQTSGEDARGESVALKGEDRTVTFDSQYLRDQVNLVFADVEEGFDIGPAKSAVHECLDRFIAEQVTVGGELLPLEGFGPYLFKDEAFIKAWANYTGFSADDIEKDLADKIQELENSKANLSGWLDTFFDSAYERLFLNAHIKAIDQHFGDKNLKNISGLGPVKLVFQQALEKFVRNPKFDEHHMVEFVQALSEDNRFVKAFSVLNKYSFSEAKKYLDKKVEEYDGFEGNDDDSWLAEILNDVKLRHTQNSKDISAVSLLADVIGKVDSKRSGFFKNEVACLWFNELRAAVANEKRKIPDLGYFRIKEACDTLLSMLQANSLILEEYAKDVNEIFEISDNSSHLDGKVNKKPTDAETQVLTSQLLVKLFEFRQQKGPKYLNDLILFR